MGVKRRRSKRKEELDASTEAWLRGDDDCGFVQFMDKEYLRDIWERYGDKTVMEWPEGARGPRKLGL